DAERAVDAAIAMVADAALPIDAAPAVGTIVVHSDRWCDVKIDGESRGRAGSGPFEVPVGRHKGLCEQAGTGNHWVRDVDVTPGKRVVVEGTMAAIVDVAIELANADGVVIDGAPYRNGAKVPLKVDRHEIRAIKDGREVGKAFVTIRAGCTLRDSPALDCY